MNMCGRYVLVGTISDLAARFQAISAMVASPADSYHAPVFRERYNITPTSDVVVVTEHHAQNGPQRVLEPMRWWIVPSWWSKPLSDLPPMFNARDDKIKAAILGHERSAFATPFRRRRCLIPTNGFYEWANLKPTPSSKPVKQPVYFSFKDKQTHAFAGLWEEWMAPDGSPLRSCTVITTTANEMVGQIHPRMPVILSPEHEADWITSGLHDSVDLLSFLAPYPTNLMTATPVSTAVNNVRNDDASLIEPIP